MTLFVAFVVDDNGDVIWSGPELLREIDARTLQERNRRLQELRKLTNDPQGDEAPMKHKTKTARFLDGINGQTFGDPFLHLEEELIG